MKNKGKFLIITGLLLIAAALFLTVYNLYDEVRARRSVMEIMACIEADIPANPSTEPLEIPEEANTTASLEEVEVPDYRRVSKQAKREMGCSDYLQRKDL